MSDDPKPDDPKPDDPIAACLNCETEIFSEGDRDIHFSKTGHGLFSDLKGEYKPS